MPTLSPRTGILVLATPAALFVGPNNKRRKPMSNIAQARTLQALLDHVKEGEEA